MKRIPVALDVIAAVLLGAAWTAAYAGPLRFDAFGVPLTVRTLWRPIVAGCLLLAVRAWLVRGPLAWRAIPQITSRVLTGSLIVAGTLGWVTFLSMTCGGADSYGYVSAADRLIEGHLVQEEPLAKLLPFPTGISAATPLGYVPSARVANASVPVYPLGLPGLMAVSRLVLGTSGPFWVAPLMGLVLIGAGHAAARAWFDDHETALLAGALLALNPLVVTYAIQPMSDVPAAAALMVAVAMLSTRRSRGSAPAPGTVPAQALNWHRAPAPAHPAALAAGLAAAVAILVRPALAIVAIGLAAVPLVVEGRRGWTSSVRYLIPVGAAVLLQASIQSYFFGDFRATGYGSLDSLFSLETAGLNLRGYSYWGFFTLGPAWLGAVLIGLASDRGRLARPVAASVWLGIGAAYVFYRPQDHWETLRFLLPAVAISTVIAASGLMTAARRMAGHQWAGAITVVVTVAMATAWMSWLTVNQVFTMPTHEARHRLVGEFVAQTTPPEAVIMALQHSGSLRYYAKRQTINWERVPDGALPGTVAALQGAGRRVYVMIDSDAERVMFEGHHGRVLESDEWLPAGQRRSVQLFEAKAVR